MRSMTGFGRGEASCEAGRVRVELKSVNHKGFDARVRAPRLLSAAEQPIIATLRGALPRGRVEVHVDLDRDKPPTRRVLLDGDALDGLLEQLQDAAHRNPRVDHEVRTGEILAASALFTVEEAPEDAGPWQQAALEAVSAALNDLSEARATEGQALHGVLTGRTEAVDALRVTIDGRMKDAPQRLGESLRARLEAHDLAPVDPQRLAQEVAQLAERVDVSEEVDRLAAHTAHFRDLCASADPVGRKLDFLCQELGREANTIGSKCNDAEVAHLVVELKAEIERLREQVQNVE